MRSFGCSYYPEMWNPDLWLRDLKQMKELGIDLVRMGEFAWGKFEPADGEFRFDGYRRMLDLCHSFGIQVMLGTPTAAPPRWLTARYPEILKIRKDGTRPAQGYRRQFCPSSELYRQYARRIVSRMGEAFRDHPAVVCWQVDNEIAAEAETGYCCCPRCRNAFREYLRKRYGTTQKLNEAWNGSFWSADVSDWDEITLPLFEERISMRLDFARFMSSSFCSMAHEHYEILKNINPSWRITTNMWTSFSPDVAPAELFEKFDDASCDTYVNDRDIGSFRAFWDYYRSVTGRRQPFTVAETGARNPVTAEPGTMRALRPWMWDMIGRGADRIIYFHWRQFLMGEENSPSILPWSGVPGEVFSLLKQNREELDSLGIDFSSLPLPDAKVAILHDTMSAFLYRCRHRDAALFRQTIETHAALTGLGIHPDVLPVKEKMDFSPYRLLILPRMEHLSEELIGQLKEFVRGGGALLAQLRLNAVDEFGKFRQQLAPAGMTDLFGLQINESSRLLAYAHPVEFCTGTLPPVPQNEMETAFGEHPVHAVDLMEKIEPLTCESMQNFTNGRFSGSPLLSINRFGKGMAFYQATMLFEPDLRLVLRAVLERCGFGELPDLPPPVARLDRGPVTVFVNSSNRRYTLEVSEKGKAVSGQYDGRILTLEPYDVCILREEAGS